MQEYAPWVNPAQTDGVGALTKSSIRILLADCHPAIMRGICSIAEVNDRYQIVAEAKNGREALQLAADVEPDIAVIAYALPELNGIDLAHAFKHCCPKLKVLLYTMYDREEIVTEAIAAGIDGVVLKTDPATELLAALDALSVHRPHFSKAFPRELVECELATRPPHILTHREREVVQLIAEGRTSKEAARVLGVSTKTVETHRSSAMHKLQIRGAAGLIRYAIRNNLIPT